MNLVFDLETRSRGWIVQGPTSPRRPLESPLADERLPGLAASLREWASRPVPLDRPDPLGTEAFVQGLARRVSDQLTQALLTEDDRRAVAAALAGNDRARLVIRVRSAGAAWDQTADAALALPWELLAPEASGVYPVREGRLAVIREAVTDLSPDLPTPSGPLTLAVTIAAPEDRAGFPYEQESFRLLAALAPLGQRAVFSNLGGLSDLAELVADLRATAIHFRGHGLPGGLLFEDELGFAHEVPVTELRRRLAAVLLDPQRAGTFPGLFFLAAPFTALHAGETSAAAALHRSGFTQVIGFFGPVGAELNTRLEERFYGALARGDSVLAAAEKARAALAEPVGEAGERVRYPFGWSQLAVYHRGADLPLARPGQGVEIPPIQRRTVEVSGLPVLEHGFIGRRGLQHEIRRRVERDGQRLVVIQGLGGLGKTALASQLLVRAFAPEPADQLVLRCREIEETDADPVLELRAQAEEHGRLHGLAFWDERVKDLRERVPDPAAGVAAVLRLLRQERPGLAVYIDNAETLQTGPSTDDPGAPGSWRPGLEVWWREMERLADEDGCLVMVTTRYAWEGLSPRAHVGLPPMEPADSLRLIDSFPALGDLPLAVRMRLAERVDGHPRTVEFLDRLIAQRRGEIREIADAWNDLIAPVLPAQEEKIRADLLLEKLWDKLSEKAREHARVLTVLRRPAPQFVIDRMGEARDELIRAGWLTRYREQVRDDSGLRWDLRWSLHQLTRDFVSRFAEGASSVAHRMAGEAWQSRLDQPLARREDQPEAIYHLHLLGEGNRAWPIVKSYVLWLRRNARFQEAQILLDSCEAAGTQGDALAIALSLSVQMRRSRGEQGEGLGDLLDRAAGLAATAETRATLYHERASWFLDRSELLPAESQTRLALEEKEKDQGTETASYAQSLRLLGMILHRQGRYVESEQVLRECVRIKAATQGESHPDSTAALHALASVLESMGRYEQAEEFLRRVIALEEETFGTDHPTYAATLHGLSLVLEHRGKYIEAENVCRKALAVFSSWLGPTHPTTLASLHALAYILESRGDYTASEKLLRGLIEIKSTTLAPDHPSLLEPLQVLAFTLWRQGKQAEAESVFARALILLEGVPPDHPVRSDFLQLASNLLDTRGHREEAEQLIHRAMTLERSSLSPLHLGHLVSLRSLASRRREQGRLLEAEGLLRHAARVIEETQGVRHPHYGRTCNPSRECSMNRVISTKARPFSARASQSWRMRWGKIIPRLLAS
jgi:tetratricopeptide (TPR) repeat protein